MRKKLFPLNRESSRKKNSVLLTESNFKYKFSYSRKFLHLE